MSEMPHELADEFPELVGKMEELKASDAGFARMYDEYHEVNRKVILAETHEKPTAHFREEEMKKQRAYLKDEIYKMLTA